MVVRVLAFFMTVGHINRDYCKRSTTDAMQYVTAKYCNKHIVPPRVAGLGCLSRDGVVSKRMNGSNVFFAQSLFLYLFYTLLYLQNKDAFLRNFISNLDVSRGSSEAWSISFDRRPSQVYHSQRPSIAETCLI